MTQRSCDIICGLPFNIASYALLVYIICTIINSRTNNNIKPDKLIILINDIHIYEEHIEPMEQLLNREFHPFPKINIKEIKENINDYEVNDFEIIGYKSNDVIKMQMIA